jgi:hypothetical protein
MTLPVTSRWRLQVSSNAFGLGGGKVKEDAAYGNTLKFNSIM